jgi:hypothetical protein
LLERLDRVPGIGPIVLTSSDGVLARLAGAELVWCTRRRVLALDGGTTGWIAADLGKPGRGLDQPALHPSEALPRLPTLEERGVDLAAYVHWGDVIVDKLGLEDPHQDTLLGRKLLGAPGGIDVHGSRFEQTVRLRVGAVRSVRDGTAGGKPWFSDAPYAESSPQPAISRFLLRPPCFPGFRVGVREAKTTEGPLSPRDFPKEIWRRDSSPRPQPWQGWSPEKIDELGFENQTPF